MSALPDSMRLSRGPRAAPHTSVEELRARIYEAGRKAVEEVRRRLPPPRAAKPEPEPEGPENV